MSKNRCQKKLRKIYSVRALTIYYSSSETFLKAYSLDSFVRKSDIKTPDGYIASLFLSLSSLCDIKTSDGSIASLFLSLSSLCVESRRLDLKARSNYRVGWDQIERKHTNTNGFYLSSVTALIKTQCFRHSAKKWTEMVNLWGLVMKVNKIIKL